jgi:hypothetical protein
VEVALIRFLLLELASFVLSWSWRAVQVDASLVVQDPSEEVDSENSDPVDVDARYLPGTPALVRRLNVLHMRGGSGGANDQASVVEADVFRSVGHMLPALQQIWEFDKLCALARTVEPQQGGMRV